MKRSLIALAIAGLASLSSLSAYAEMDKMSQNISGAARLTAQDCSRGERSDLTRGGRPIVPQDPISFTCYLSVGFEDGAGSEQASRLSEQEYNLALVKLAGLRNDPRIKEAERQQVVLANLATEDKARAEEAAKGIVRRTPVKQADGTIVQEINTRTYSTELDLFAVHAMERNVAKARHVVALTYQAPDRSVKATSSGIADECDNDLFRARLDLAKMDEVQRKVTVDAFNNRCKERDAQVAAIAAARAKQAAAQNELAENGWSLEPVPAINEMSAKAVNANVLRMLEAGELFAVEINVDPDAPTLTLVLDNSPKSKRLAAQAARLVSQKKRNVHVVPTSLYSGDAALAAEMLAKGSSSYLAQYAALKANWKSAYKASPELLAKVAQSNEKLLAAKLNGVPFRSVSDGTRSVPGFGVLPSSDRESGADAAGQGEPVSYWEGVKSRWSLRNK